MITDPKKTCSKGCTAFRKLKSLQYRTFQYPHTIRTLIGTEQFHCASFSESASLAQAQFDLVAHNKSSITGLDQSLCHCFGLYTFLASLVNTIAGQFLSSSTVSCPFTDGVPCSLSLNVSCAISLTGIGCKETDVSRILLI